MTPATAVAEVRKVWTHQMHKNLRAAIGFGDLHVGDCPEEEAMAALHGVICRLGGHKAFAELMHAALIDPEVSVDSKAELLGMVQMFWLLANRAYEPRRQEKVGRLTDEDLRRRLDDLQHGKRAAAQKRRRERERQSAKSGGNSG